MNKVLVTGGCGFIGSHFVHLLLSKGYEVVNVDKLTYAATFGEQIGVEGKRGYTFAKGDIADRPFVSNLVQSLNPWAIVNFAAETHVDRSILDASPFIHTNVTGVQVLLEAVRQFGVKRFIQISTDEIYGDAYKKRPFVESSPMKPSSPYSASKAAGELLCIAHQRTYAVPVLVVRSSNNFGPRQHPEKLIPLIIKKCLSREALPVYGNGMQKRDWLYVEDNCNAILTVLEHGKLGSVYNVAANDERHNLETVKAVCKTVSRESGGNLQDILGLIKFVSDRPGHDLRYAINTGKVRQELGWSPSVSFEDGLTSTVKWYLANPEWLGKAASSENFKKYYESVYSRKWSAS